MGNELEDLTKRHREQARTLAQRVRARLTALDITPTAAARSVGLEQGFITDILRGRKSSVQGRNLEKLANALRCAPNDLISDDMTVELPPWRKPDPEETIPVIGEVNAGVWIDVNTEAAGPISYKVPYPVALDVPIAEQFEVVVKGTSINRLAHEGQFIRCGKYEELIFWGDEQIAIVERFRGSLRQRLAMRVVSNTVDGTTFDFVSDDPRWSGTGIRVDQNGVSKNIEGETIKIVGVALFAYTALKGSLD